MEKIKKEEGKNWVKCLNWEIKIIQNDKVKYTFLLKDVIYSLRIEKMFRHHRSIVNFYRANPYISRDNPFGQRTDSIF